MSSRLELLSSGGLRLDNRRPNELRQIGISFEKDPPIGIDSSVSIRHGQTNLISSVSGPKDIYSINPSINSNNPSSNSNSSSSSQQIQVFVSNSPFGSIDRKRSIRNDKGLIDLELAIQSTFQPVIMLELYQRSKIEIFVEIIEQDGSLLQAAINGTTLALITAGISISDYVLSVSIGSLITNSNSNTYDYGEDEDGEGEDQNLIGLVDLSQEEEKDLNNLTISYLPRSSKTSLIQLDQSRFQIEHFKRLLIIGLEACKVLHQRFEDEIKNVWAKQILNNHDDNKFVAGKQSDSGKRRKKENFVGGKGLEGIDELKPKIQNIQIDSS